MNLLLLAFQALFYRTSPRIPFCGSAAAMDQVEIDGVVHSFLEYAKDNDRPIRQLTDLLSLLQSQGWNQAAIREVQEKALSGIAGLRGQSP